MRSIFYPGEGFPGRLERYLFGIGKRPADVERDTDGVVKADTVRGWLKRKHFPEKLTYLQFCRCYHLDRETAQEILFGPASKRDSQKLLRETPVGELLGSLEANLSAVQGVLIRLSADELNVLQRRLELAVNHVRTELGTSADGTGTSPS